MVSIEHIGKYIALCNFCVSDGWFLYSWLCKQGKYDQEHEQSEEFQQQLKLKVREILTDQEWRRRKMAMRVCSLAVFFICHLFGFLVKLTVWFCVDIWRRRSLEERWGRNKRDVEKKTWAWGAVGRN